MTCFPHSTPSGAKWLRTWILELDLLGLKTVSAYVTLGTLLNFSVPWFHYL